ncbi:type VII secretion protein EssB [Halalkalibacter hemicellulosilyticus]|uniref:Putative secretion system component EssB/YukC n=1 Tax=Halalkalibacter hemicellulosilyticusJCM 9152 TaxID=1236971 RepID=W4QJ00_9BACI|nr:type VII secretion protein EssB [Halalkalibacter hemicellulosilyticus]GAE32061.1 putative secretion system component EssB/YukC [Halalkalibacter hemicellulosilyticusJCM 9152]
MKEKKIQLDSLTLHFQIEGEEWRTELAKSQTKVKSIQQMGLITTESDYFLPVSIEEEEDLFRFSFVVEDEKKKWKDIKALQRNEKLRLLWNLAKLKPYLSTRTTFFLHPDNVVFDDNLMPAIMYRGIRQLLPPYEVKEDDFFLQYKCFILALFSKQYTFDDLYNGSLKKVKETEFERHVHETESLEELITYIQTCYHKEQQKTEKTMTTVPLKRFRLFKQLSIIMMTLSIVLAVPLFYYMFVKDPYQDKLLTAHGEFLSSDYSAVISTLRREDPEPLPFRTKYILAYSYIQVESLSNREKEAIMRNVSLRSDENYLLYWILNGRGHFDESIEKAMFIDDPQLIMYGLIQQMEQVRNDPQLSGSEREEEVRRLQDELNRYQDDYLGEDEETERVPVEGANAEQELDLETDEDEEIIDNEDEDE